MFIFILPHTALFCKYFFRKELAIITQFATISVPPSAFSYNTLTDWGLAVGNTDIIGEPVAETYYLDVPGADGFLDYSESLTGRTVYKERQIKLTLGGKKPVADWQSFMADIRNLLHGKIIRIVFSELPGWYFTGRCEITGFSRFRELGNFTLSIPKADPYGYCVQDNSTERWLWDPLDLNHGVADDPVSIPLNSSSQSVTLLHSSAPYNVSVNVTSVSPDIVMTAPGKIYNLHYGLNPLAAVEVNDTDVILTFTGTGTVSLYWRRRII